ncbi:speedy protein 1-A-like [Pelobates fuscus]|uniref:speedy protein 1-A-like n=1 Tax=Pelobates fuscus TaxID=191477 RepID=UPI002FE4C5EF
MNTMEDSPVRKEEREEFFKLLENDIIKEYLDQDRCLRTSDKFLLAMVLAYFHRAKMDLDEYNVLMFFTALSLANMVEEDEPFQREIYPWVLGQAWFVLLPEFERLRNLFWERMNYRGLVTRSTCEQIMGEDPMHWAWLRVRKDHHSWVFRSHLRWKDEYRLRGPGRSPINCYLCAF